MAHEDGKSTETIEGLLGDLELETPKRFSHEQLRTFTSNFSIKLGSGGFGDVYKGTLHNGVPVAVKVLKEALMSDDQFKAEVRSLGNINHKHVVKLYGFCFEQNGKALVYEFMENGSLENKSIVWETLCNIVVGTAKGLAYLHEDCQPSILHYDVKPANILLDSKFSPKVGDFGLAKLLDQGTTHITESRTRGTPDYVAPELIIKCSKVNHKCDVYSFGISLFDIIGRRRHVPVEGENWFPIQVLKKFKEEKQEDIMQECDIQEKDRKQAKRILLIALQCTQFRPDDRPSMSYVVRLLEGTEEVKLPLDHYFMHMDSSSAVTKSVRQEVEEDNISHMTLGPWGGYGRDPWDDGTFAGIKKIEVFTRNEDVVGIQVWYCKKDGESISTKRHGILQSDKIDKMELDYPSEYLIRVTGFYSYDFGNLGFGMVRSLCFFTNKKIYGPFGDERGIYFTSENDGKDGKVVGFHGREGEGLDAIGMHMEYNKDHPEKVKENDAVNVARLKPTTVGPWGGAGWTNWDDGVYAGIKKINICKGIKGDIQSMQIWYCGKDGDPICSERHGNIAHTEDTIELDYPSEYLVRVTGSYGFGDLGDDQVGSLCFYSNKKTCGPFGVEKGSYFSTEKDGKDGKVIGFYGNSGAYLYAIGMHMDYS